MGEHNMRYEIPGTVIFDGTEAQKGYALNKMCFSFNEEMNRQEFLKDEDAYCRAWGLTDAQCDAIKNKEVLRLIELGGHPYYLAKFAGIFHLDMQDLGALQTGVTKEEFQARLVAAGR